MDDNAGSKIKKVEKSKMISEAEIASQGISYKTIGTTLQALAVQLDEGEVIYSQAGKMAWLTDNVEMKTKGQGVRKMFSRMFANESIFINEFKCQSGTGIVTFSTDQAGKILPLELNQEKPAIIFQRGSYLCSEKGIERSTVLIKKISAGLFGGKGFVLQKLSGSGRSHLIADGEVVMYELKEGERILVDQGNLIAYEETVDFDIQTVQGGVKNWLFGGEGLFLGSMTGPGKIWMQTRKLSLANAAGRAVASNSYNSGRSNNPLGCLLGLVISACFFIFWVVIAILSNT